jgi:glycosyltransferase involved in cell wall biosynthesis
MTSAPDGIALLVPCHNAAPYLPRLAQSIAAQAGGFAEMLFYDDGSTDETVAVARGLGLPIITGQPNRGVSHARNQLAQAASQPWLHFHDADDPILPDFVARMRPLLVPGTDVAVADADWLDETGAAVILPLRYPPDAFSDPLTANLRTGIACNNMIVRRAPFLAVGGFAEDLRMWEDADLHIRLAADGAHYAALGEVAAISIRRPASFSHDYKANWNWRLRALESYAQTLPPRVRAEIALQAEIAARALLRYDDPAAAARALALNHRLGGDAPVTNQPVLKILKRILPSLTTLRIQERFRST